MAAKQIDGLATIPEADRPVLGRPSPTKKVIAAELVTNVRKSVTIDWTVRESARAKIRILVKRILRRHSYPSNLQAEAMRLVLEQAEAILEDIAA